MKFNIFSWKESFGKILLYLLTMFLTGVLLFFYYLSFDEKGNIIVCIKDTNGTIALGISVIYALILFIIGIKLAAIDRYTAERIYEREKYYFSLKKLREVVDATIRKVVVDDPEEYWKCIMQFQLFTGRVDNKSETEEKLPVYVKENGFTYTDKMKRLENEYIIAYRKKDEKKLAKKGKKLKKVYDKGIKKLEKNYITILKMYGGNLQDLIEKDENASDNDFFLRDIVSKIEDISYELNSIKEDISDIISTNDRNQNEIIELCNELINRIDNIEILVSEDEE